MHGLSIRDRSRAMSERGWANICSVLCPISPRLRSRVTSPGCWRPMRGTASLASSPRRTPHRSRRCVRRWKTHWESASRANAARPFFHSTLAQTLFYGIFSAWVLWANRTPTPQGRFNWRESVWHLRAPRSPRAVPADFRPGPAPAARTGGDAGLDGGRAGPR